MAVRERMLVFMLRLLSVFTGSGVRLGPWGSPTMLFPMKYYKRLTLDSRMFFLHRRADPVVQPEDSGQL